MSNIMNPYDFRLGNLVMRYGKVHALRFGDMIADFEGCEVIPITEEWLVSFGFTNNVLCFYGFNLSYLPETKQFRLKKLCKNSGNILNHILYIHNLQNLYYSLIGKELHYEL